MSGRVDEVPCAACGGRDFWTRKGQPWRCLHCEPPPGYPRVPTDAPLNLSAKADISEL